jgi:hypothetical protein
MTDWLYNGEPYYEPGEYYGFVYIIENLLSGRKYIGKKFFWSIKRKQVNKKRKSYKVESDWKEYWSSSDELKTDIESLGRENFKRTIIHLCPSKGVTNYLEAKEQMLHAVLEDSNAWYNSWIMVKVHRSHIKNKMKAS